MPHPFDAAWAMLKALPEQQMYASMGGADMPPMENLADIAEARAAPQKQPGYPSMSEVENWGHMRPDKSSRMEAERQSPYEDTGYPYEDEHAIAGTVHPAIRGLLERLAEPEQGRSHPGYRTGRPSLDLDRGRIQQDPRRTFGQYDNPLFEEAADMARRREMEEEEKRWKNQRLVQELGEQTSPFSGPEGTQV